MKDWLKCQINPLVKYQKQKKRAAFSIFGAYSPGLQTHSVEY